MHMAFMITVGRGMDGFPRFLRCDGYVDTPMFM